MNIIRLTHHYTLNRDEYGVTTSRSVEEIIDIISLCQNLYQELPDLPKTEDDLLEIDAVFILCKLFGCFYWNSLPEITKNFQYSTIDLYEIWSRHDDIDRLRRDYGSDELNQAIVDVMIADSLSKNAEQNLVILQKIRNREDISSYNPTTIYNEPFSMDRFWGQKLTARM
jgi:hypothetical protein